MSTPVLPLADIQQFVGDTIKNIHRGLNDAREGGVLLDLPEDGIEISFLALKEANAVQMTQSATDPANSVQVTESKPETTTTRTEPEHTINRTETRGTSETTEQTGERSVLTVTNQNGSDSADTTIDYTSIDDPYSEKE